MRDVFLKLPKRSLITSCLIIAVVALGFLTISPRKYQIRITIPAGGMEAFYYSDEEISPKGKKLTLSNGDGLGDTQVILKAVESRQENAYDEPVYMTPGMPVKMNVEKGAWFKIGVSVQNPTEEDLDVYVEAENVEVRISGTVDVGEKADEIPDTTAGWVKEEINAEKYDVTHDGIPDEIITSLEYDPAFADVDTAQQEMEQQLKVGFLRVEVFRGKENPADRNKEHAIWAGEYSSAHTGNGQLSIVHKDGQDWMLTSSLNTGQGFAALEYKIFSLDQNGQEEILDKQSAEFEMIQRELPDAYKEFQASLNQYTEDGILLIACDIDLEDQFVRTKDTPWVPQDYYENAFKKFEVETY